MDKVTVAVPLGRTVNYTGITNAGWQQQAIVSFDDGTTFQLTGTGENVSAGGPGSFKVPSDFTSPVFNATITINHRPTDNDAWEPSDLQFDEVTVGGVTTVIVASEDAAPGFEPDYNDFVLQLAWFN